MIIFIRNTVLAIRDFKNNDSKKKLKICLEDSPLRTLMFQCKKLFFIMSQRDQIMYRIGFIVLNMIWGVAKTLTGYLESFKVQL